MLCSSGHEVPRDAEDGGEDGDAGEDVLLLSTVQVVLHPRAETPAAGTRGLASHRRRFGSVAAEAGSRTTTKMKRSEGRGRDADEGARRRRGRPRASCKREGGGVVLAAVDGRDGTPLQ